MDSTVTSWTRVGSRVARIAERWENYLVIPSALAKGGGLRTGWKRENPTFSNSLELMRTHFNIHVRCYLNLCFLGVKAMVCDSTFSTMLAVHERKCLAGFH